MYVNILVAKYWLTHTKGLNVIISNCRLYPINWEVKFLDMLIIRNSRKSVISR